MNSRRFNDSSTLRYFCLSLIILQQIISASTLSLSKHLNAIDCFFPLSDAFGITHVTFYWFISQMASSLARAGWRLLDVCQRHRVRLSASTIARSEKYFSSAKPVNQLTADEGYVCQSMLEPVQVPNVTLDEYVWRNLHQWPNHTAVVRIFGLLLLLLSSYFDVSANYGIHDVRVSGK